MLDSVELNYGEMDVMRLSSSGGFQKNCWRRVYRKTILHRRNILKAPVELKSVPARALFEKNYCEKFKIATPLLSFRSTVLLDYYILHTTVLTTLLYYIVS